MLDQLKERFLNDERTLGAVADLQNLYESADDVEAFHRALADGEIDEAAEYHPLPAAELHSRIDDIMQLGTDMAEDGDYDDILDHSREEFINA